ncbi:hypothetical protein E4P42_08280 [Mycobacterium sp. PS03-16]|uniref:hypothetical protein n=1 Tax=Mycobacterium sp. PS03-16 TaxID=2559611 RepID=UPI0010744D70|nr:hypothetical protein [Mycobacterium sp. PS03-16]TFV59401.1 hypothetical protein E4P42_08280 [Mycobacterium sp. PS03-16]
MNDSQRRLDRIVKWIYEVADPWMQDAANAQPQPGSDLAVDDAEHPPSSPLSHRGKVMALDHLGAVVDAVAASPPMRLNAHFTALRTALICGARVCWLLEPDSSNGRQLRAIRYRYENLEEQRKAMTDFADTHLNDDEDKALAESLVITELERQALNKRALELGAKLTTPTSTTQMMKDLVNLTTPGGTGMVHLWRTGSASAHGHYWADDMRDNPAAFDHKWFQPAIQGTVLTINDALILRRKRATTRSGRD